MHIKSTLAMQTLFKQKIYRHKYACITAILLSTRVALEKNLISRDNTPREAFFIPLASNIKKGDQAKFFLDRILEILYEIEYRFAYNFFFLTHIYIYIHFNNFEKLFIMR